MVANDALLTNHTHYRRGLTIQDTCILCASSSKTMLHTLRDCPIAKELWKSVGISFIINSFFQRPLFVWLEENLQNETRCAFGINWPLLFIIARSSLWCYHNLVIFYGKTNAHSFLACNLLKLAKDY